MLTAGGDESGAGAVQYANAKVVLVGDSGVGKSGLGIVLSGQPYRATDSTHGRRVWMFETNDVEEGDRRETRETLLWDLAGQPGYRLIHQLHLREVAVALVVFDSRSETDPFSGVRHWDRALRLAQRVQGDSAPAMRKFLVAARADRGGVSVSRERISSFLAENTFDGFFETSSKEGWQIEDLRNAVLQGIAWDSLPRVNSSDLFQRIKEFLISEKESGRLLAGVTDLYRAFLRSEGAPLDTELLRRQFETCIGRVENRDLIRRLNFGNLVLLQPELLDAYASAIVNAAKDEPDGLGCISEKVVQSGTFRMSHDEKIRDKEQEKLLLIATIEGLVLQEIALREHADDGPYLVFPSQFTRDWEDAPDPPGRTVVISFEGPLLNVYATLAVRLSHSGLFSRHEMWRNASTFRAGVGGSCGLYLREFGEGKGELTLFYDESASGETRFNFEAFVLAHLKVRALTETIQVRRIVFCPACQEPVPDRTIVLRRTRGFDWVQCAACDGRVPFTDAGSSGPKDEKTGMVARMARSADAERSRAAAVSIVEGKRSLGKFDVFLCHNSEDKPEVKEIGERLKSLGILPWLDEWELRPGLGWQKALEQQIDQIGAAAVFVGSNGLGPWQEEEIYAFLREFMNKSRQIIPVLLKSAPEKPDLPIFLKGRTWSTLAHPHRNR